MNNSLSPPLLPVGDCFSSWERSSNGPVIRVRYLKITVSVRLRGIAAELDRRELNRTLGYHLLMLQLTEGDRCFGKGSAIANTALVLRI